MPNPLLCMVCTSATDSSSTWGWHQLLLAGTNSGPLESSQVVVIQQHYMGLIHFSDVEVCLHCHQSVAVLMKPPAPISVHVISSFLFCTCGAYQGGQSVHLRAALALPPGFTGYVPVLKLIGLCMTAGCQKGRSMVHHQRALRIPSGTQSNGGCKSRGETTLSISCHSSSMPWASHSTTHFKYH